jgi:hypothetical protein
VVGNLHPTLLLPAAAPVLAAFAAVVQFLSDYWVSLYPVPRQLAGELLLQLNAVGLCGQGGNYSAAASAAGWQSTAAAAEASSMLDGSRNDLALLLLSSSKSEQQQQQQQVGQALLQHCLSLLQAAGPAAVGSWHAHGCSKTPIHVHGMGDTLAVHAMASAAAGLLLGVCELQQLLQKHSHGVMVNGLAPPQQQEQQEEQQGMHNQAAAAAADAGGASCPSGNLASAVVSAVAANVLLWLKHTPGRGALVLEPWRLAHYNLQQYQLQLLLKLAPVVLQQQQQQQQQQLVMRVVDALLGVLPLSAPGQEAQALQALTVLFDTQQQQQQHPAAAAALLPTADVLAAAVAAIQQLRLQGGTLAAAAAGVRADALDKAATGATTSLPYPAPALLDTAAAIASGTDSSAATSVDPAVWCKALLQGYAVTWLSVIADTSPQQQQQQQQQQASAASKLPQPPPPLPLLPRVFVAEAEGSRLPAPPEWLLSEIHAVPHTHLSSSSGSNAGGSGSSGGYGPMHPAAAALLLACGLQQQQQDSSSGSSSYMDCISPGRWLEALLRLMYNFDVWELLPPAAAAAAGGWQQQQQQQQQLEPAWQSAPARWGATVLTQQICQQVLGGSAAAATAAAAETQQQQQQQQHGDLYPCQVKTLLQGAQGVTPQAHPQQQQQQQRRQLFPTWSAAPAAAQVVDRLVVDLSDVSFGDPLFGAHVALLLLPAAGVRMQRACWRALMDHRSVLE